MRSGIKKPCRISCKAISGGRGWIRTTEAEATDLQSAPFGHSGTLPYWSWWTDSNPRPADYKSAALPTELHQRLNFVLSFKHSVQATIKVYHLFRVLSSTFFRIYISFTFVFEKPDFSALVIVNLIERQGLRNKLAVTA